MRRSRLVPLLVTPLLLVSCYKIEKLQRPGVANLPPRPPKTIPTERSSEGQSTYPTQKPVYGKEAPTTLLAADGTRCQVSEKKFQETTVGEKIWCVWQ